MVRACSWIPRGWSHNSKRGQTANWARCCCTVTVRPLMTMTRLSTFTFPWSPLTDAGGAILPEAHHGRTTYRATGDRGFLPFSLVAHQGALSDIAVTP